MKPLKYIFFAAVTGLGLAGCVQAPSIDAYCMSTTGAFLGVAGFTSTTFDHKCARTKVASDLIGTNNPTLVAVGLAVVRNGDPVIEKSAGEVAADIRKDHSRQPISMQRCPIKGSGTGPDGEPYVDLDMANCKREENPPPALPAPAPAGLASS